MNQELKDLDSNNLENRIMLVDDEEFCLSTMNSMLFNLGVDTKKRVDICISALEASDRIKEAYKIGIKYDLILMDFNMP